jgi:hypothetical protein
MLSIVLALTLAVAITLLLQARIEPGERRWVWFGFAGHQLGAGALLLLHEAGGSDMAGYAGDGATIGALLRIDFPRWMPEVVNVVLRRESALPIDATATGAMKALSGVVFFVVGDSLPAACILVSAIVLVGQVLLYRVFRAELTAADRPHAAVGCLLVPSVAFWTSGLIKEAFCLAGLGMVAFGLRTLLVERRASALPVALMGALLIAAVKPYTLLPVVLGASAWMFSARTGGHIRIGYVLAALALGVLGIAFVGRLFPEYGVGQLAESFARARHFSGQAGGGSYVGDGDDAFTEGDPTAALGVKYLPLAMVNALFRPFIFEVRNVTQLAAAIETTAIVVVVVTLVWRVRFRQLFDVVLRSPALFASVVFVLSFGAAVGLASQNIGTVSRYRVPMMPFYISFVLIMRRQLTPAALALPVPVRGIGPKGRAGARALARARARRSASRPARPT